MKIAVEGCCHGELDRTYLALKELETRTNQNVDALIICGDFQAVRNQSDLLCMAVPPKYRRLGQFHEYYTGKKSAPLLTIVIGGNHEASNYMWELYHGGWLAPNIYYLGGSGCVRLNGIRIAGASGIFKQQDYNSGHFERTPYNNSSLRSVYHVRAYDIFKLSLLSPGPEIFLSHDWPEGIYSHGDTAALLLNKPFFKNDIAKGELGNPYTMDILKLLRPMWWFSAHLHVRFQAEYDHTGEGVSSWGTGGRQRQVPPRNADEIVMEDTDIRSSEEHPNVPSRSADEIVMDNEEDNAAVNAPKVVSPKSQATILGDNDQAPTSGESVLPSTVVKLGPSSLLTSMPTNLPKTTKFLALDKCLPRRKFLEIVDVPSPYTRSPPSLTYDNEWLAISRALHPLLSTDRRSGVLPRLSLAREWVQRELEWIEERMVSRGASDETDGVRVESIQQFAMTASGPSHQSSPTQYPIWYTNPQTEAFCTLIGVENKVNPVPREMQWSQGSSV